jgi:hypothetical protein
VNETVPDCTASLKVALGAVETVTPVAPETGVCELTAGCNASVVKDQVVDPLIGSPSASLAPLTAAVYVVPYVKAVLGVNVSVFVVLL